MISTRDPESMTADERRLEVAAILARGLVRHFRGVKAAEKRICECSQNQLDVSAKTRLMVAQRPAG